MRATCWNGRDTVTVENVVRDPEISTSDAIVPSFVVSHRMALEQAPAAYELFEHKRDNCTKIVLTP